MFIRKYNKLNINFCNINLLFWYKHVPADDLIYSNYIIILC